MQFRFYCSLKRYIVFNKYMCVCVYVYKVITNNKSKKSPKRLRSRSKTLKKSNIKRSSKIILV